MNCISTNIKMQKQISTDINKLQTCNLLNCNHVKVSTCILTISHYFEVLQYLNNKIRSKSLHILSSASVPPDWILFTLSLNLEVDA